MYCVKSQQLKKNSRCADAPRPYCHRSPYALTIDGAFSKRMGILQKEVKARQQVVYEDTAMCQSLFLRPFASLLSSQYF